MPISNRTNVLLGEPHNAFRIFQPLRNVRNGHTFPPYHNGEQASISKYHAKSPVRSLVNAMYVTVYGPGVNKQVPGQLATQDKGKKSNHAYCSLKTVRESIKAKLATVKHRTQSLVEEIGSFYPQDTITHTDKCNSPSRVVQYRDIDLGPRRQAIYADTIVDLRDSEEISDFNFEPSAWISPSPRQIEAPHSSWGGLDCPVDRAPCDSHALARFYNLSPPTYTIVDNAEEDLSRTTTHSTERKASGEFLRCLQTGSSAASRLLSHNTTSASVITLPLSEDGDNLTKTPARKTHSIVEEMPESEAGRSEVCHNSVNMVSLLGDGMSDFESRDANGLQEIILVSAEEQMETRRSNGDSEIYVDRESPKDLLPRVEQPANGDDESYTITTPDDPEVVTRRYGKFDLAFTQQVKDYSKLLDDLADPEATARALELVSSRLSVYLNNNNSSSADVGLVRPANAEAPEKRKLRVFSGLEAFFNREGSNSKPSLQAGSTKVFTCPVKPMPTPFSDLEQFIEDDDLDPDLDMSTGGLMKLTSSNVPNWDLFEDNNETENGVTQQNGAKYDCVRIAAR